MHHHSAFREFGARLRQFIQSSMSSFDTGRTASVVETHEEFNGLALELVRLQWGSNAAYRKLCQQRGFSPGDVRTWQEVPAMPTAGFKEHELTSLPLADRTLEFHSSGTTGQVPSRHLHGPESLALYEASLLPWFRLHLGLGTAPAPTGMRLVMLSPAPDQAPHSSLVHMFETIRRTWRWAGSVWLADAEADGSWRQRAGDAVQVLGGAAASGEPVLLLGPAFAFVHLIDDFTRRGLQIQLPVGSRVMETGGYKGRSRQLTKAELFHAIERNLGVPRHEIVTEYGMTELSSQAYDREVDGMASDVGEGRRPFRFPPWVRVRVVSPDTGLEVPPGELGLLQVFDLANVWSVMAIQTEDLASRHSQGFELHGRASVAEPRGCSLMPAA